MWPRNAPSIAASVGAALLAMSAAADMIYDAFSCWG
jgi:hypothetical protein